MVGIDKYVLSNSTPADEVEPSSAGATATASSKIKRNRRFINLDGAVNDATLFRQILNDRFGFPAADVLFLKDQEATRERILHAFQTHLIDEASSSDISLFYYAGHGSQVQNLASDEADQLDETLVPADSYSGAPDIRDKEMARLYRAALRKGVHLTVILDSCHSGGMSRGNWNRSGKTRNLPPDPRPINDPPDRDPVTGKNLPDATSMGMLFLAAAREDQPAGETSVTERGPNGTVTEVAHGAFTAALTRVLASPVANQSVEQICNRVQSMLASEGRVQVPICAGNGRNDRGLLGQVTGGMNSLTLTAGGVNSSGFVRLRGGSALGLAQGSTLVRLGGQLVRIELTRVDLGMSEAKFLAGAAAGAVRTGDVFKLETWAAPPSASIKVFLPKDGPDADALRAVAGIVKKLGTRDGIQVLSDLDKEARPTHVLYWREGSFHIEHFPSVSKPVSLGASPTLEAMTKALGNVSGVRLWPILPPDRRLVSQIRLGTGTENPAVQIVNDPADSIYLLAGRLNHGAIEYSWIFKDVLMAVPNETRLPLATDWAASGEQLTSLALRLARIYGWLNLSGPAGEDNAFPYHLILEKAGSHEPAGGSPFKFGERYKFVFQANPDALKQASTTGGIARRYVYVFLIDSAGNAACFFPNPDNGNIGNLLPRDDSASPRIEATRSDYDVEISAPAGTDNYFLVASEQPLDPGIFQWEGVRGPEGRRAASNPLEFLFSSVGETTRGAHPVRSVPVTWSIQSFAVRSIP